MGTGHLCGHPRGHLRLCLGDVQRLVEEHGRLQLGILAAFHGQLGQRGCGRLEVGTVEEGARRWTASRVDEEGFVDGVSQQLVQLVRRHKVTPLRGKLCLRLAVEGVATRLHGHHHHAHRPDVHARWVVSVEEALGRQVEVLSGATLSTLQQRLSLGGLPEGHRLAPAGNLQVVLLAEEQVLQLQKAVGDAQGGHRLKAVYQLDGPGAGHLGADGLIVEELQKERLAGRFLQEHVDGVIELKDIVHSNERLGLDLAVIDAAHVPLNLQTVRLHVGQVPRSALLQANLLHQQSHLPFGATVEAVHVIFDDLTADGVPGGVHLRKAGHRL